MSMLAEKIWAERQGAPVLNGVSYEFRMNRFYGIIGPNGVGKSTLLHILSGVDAPSRGVVSLDGQPISDIAGKTLARRLAVLQQGGLPAVGFSVREVVAMGRFPHQNWLGGEASDPEPIIEEALSVMGLAELQNRKLHQLSGGERQRVALAKLMVQQPDILLLDEPTTYLDIGYQIGLLDTVRAWQQEKGLLVIAVLHDLNLAAMYADELIALHKGSIAAAGTPEEVMDPLIIEDMYGTRTIMIKHPVSGAPQLMLQPGARSGHTDRRV
ncbi:ABC transporter ATP-binding protein [Paenibacillus soyae]|uniref:ABC transporter ATP-binding protein n=1 Tax=Paenibacillus soyae TaxID=2969249 RepID=A0A9X2MRJ2_9BACL|nr:ABC transporter ATP-binding protein [Paenibacillus soyae]MCR2805524.1 ABC transporter ATP-binding protein [Paenibacillus soyae]